MYVESIELSHYRNYDSAKIQLSPGVNIFFGDNAQGKTNLLEAVYVSGTTRSHRKSKDKEMIRFDMDEAHIRLHFIKDSLSHRLDLHLKRNKPKGVALDGIPLKKTSELYGMLPVVFFSPEDLGIIKNGPSERRRFLDMEMSQLDRSYLTYLANYQHLLTERNNLLKQIYLFPSLKETLDGWDEQLVRTGLYIIKKRQSFLLRIDEMMGEIHGNLSGGKENMRVFYDKNISCEEFRDKLMARRDRDIRTGSTSVGPHRDDIAFQIDGIDIRRFGSQGQQRTAALALKLSEIRLVEQISGEKPVLLLDDVLSELDGNRQQFLLESISDIQALISCTGLDDFVHSRIQMDKIFHVENGKIMIFN